MVASVGAFVLAGLCWAGQVSASPPKAQSGPRSERTGVRDFAPGIRIDWGNLTVELAAEVALREGPLELLACSPQTKEHESVLVVRARPLRVFQAMGLIGLESGSPVRFDEKTRRWTPATGEALDLRIRCDTPSPEKEVPAASWLVQTDTQKPPSNLDWVFSGSRSDSRGRFGADSEGTVACLVGFDSALISLATAHSADDEELWLKANTKAIPPRGTGCTLLVRSAYCRTVEVEVEADGSLRLEDKRVSAAELLAEVRRHVGDDRPVRLLIRLAEKTSDSDAERIRKEIVSKRFDGVIELRRSDGALSRKPSPQGPDKSRD